jgi:hypothetical protein
MIDVEANRPESRALFVFGGDDDDRASEPQVRTTATKVGSDDGNGPHHPLTTGHPHHD